MTRYELESNLEVLQKDLQTLGYGALSELIGTMCKQLVVLTAKVEKLEADK